MPEETAPEETAPEEADPGKTDPEETEPTAPISDPETGGDLSDVLEIIDPKGFHDNDMFKCLLMTPELLKKVKSKYLGVKFLCRNKKNGTFEYYQYVIFKNASSYGLDYGDDIYIGDPHEWVMDNYSYSYSYKNATTPFRIDAVIGGIPDFYGFLVLLRDTYVEPEPPGEQS
jgi:hypothetical protein